jgi:hypothetical protein
MYRIDHPLYRNVVFKTQEDLDRTAKFLCDFMIRQVGKDCFTIESLHFIKDTGDEEPQWYFFKSYKSTYEFEEAEGRELW